MKIALKYSIVILLIVVIILLSVNILMKYSITPFEIHGINSANLIVNGSFEEFNQTVGDCCTVLEKAKEAIVYAEKSIDAYEGDYSLSLTSSNHCACINKEINKLDNSQKYLISFYYKGDNPRFCNWISGENKCLSVRELLKTVNWSSYKGILTFTNNSESAYIYLYADSDGTKTVTNLYDDLQVHKLIPIENPKTFEYKKNETYIIKTKADNNVNGEMISDVVDGEAYFMVKGEPRVTLKFPWSEIAIMAIMLMIIIRLMFKKKQ